MNEHRRGRPGAPMGYDEAADTIGVAARTLRDAEDGWPEALDEVCAALTHHGVPLGRYLSHVDALRLLRRRSGIAADAAAKLVGVSRPVFYKYEAGGDDRLLRALLAHTWRTDVLVTGHAPDEWVERVSEWLQDENLYVPVIGEVSTYFRLHRRGLIEAARAVPSDGVQLFVGTDGGPLREVALRR